MKLNLLVALKACRSVNIVYLSVNMGLHFQSLIFIFKLSNEQNDKNLDITIES